jgi:predicted AAA+ superfamily ATPase
MKRDIEKTLIEWKDSPVHLPIMLRGARQVGKSYTVEEFGRIYFKNIVIVNFEQQPEFIKCFESLQPKIIINLIELALSVDIIPGETLLFLDEIQECPNAIVALRYFKEQMSELHVIAAGSLLELVLQAENFSMPVGRIQFFYLKPLSFKEFLTAGNQEKLRRFIEEFQCGDTVHPTIHNKLLELVRHYIVLGGMPAALATYFETGSMRMAQNIQTILLTNYENDFAKYAKGTSIETLKLLFRRIPDMVTQQFKYVRVSPDIQSRELKVALDKLGQANIVYPVYATAATGLPLNALINTKKFKLLFLDVGLVERSSRLDAELLLQEDLLLINKGAIAEQFVGQELLAYQDILEMPETYFWARDKKNANAEVDYVTNVGRQIVPIEVKSGTQGRLKSLKLFLKEYQLPLGVRLSLSPPEQTDNILNLPLYMVGEINRLIASCDRSPI